MNKIKDDSVKSILDGDGEFEKEISQNEEKISYNLANEEDEMEILNGIVSKKSRIPDYKINAEYLNYYLRWGKIVENCSGEYGDINFLQLFKKELCKELKELPILNPHYRQPLFRGTKLPRRIIDSILSEKRYADRGFLSTCFVKYKAAHFIKMTGNPTYPNEKDESDLVCVLFEIKEYKSARLIKEDEGFECVFLPETQFEYLEHDEIIINDKPLYHIKIKEVLTDINHCEGQ